jgi:hypothetical protein
MTLDYAALMYDPIYQTLGVPATLTQGVTEISLTVVDNTKPVTIAVVGAPGEVRSVGPGAYARVQELAAQGFTRAQYIDATLAFNGRTWVVRSYEFTGNPNGEDMGEVRFLLKEAAVG